MAIYEKNKVNRDIIIYVRFKMSLWKLLNNLRVFVKYFNL